MEGDRAYVVGKGDDVEGVAYYAVFVERLRIVYTFKGDDLSRVEGTGAGEGNCSD